MKKIYLKVAKKVRQWGRRRVVADKKTHVLEDLYYGRLRPIDHMIPKNKKYSRLCEEIERETACFVNKMSEEDRNRHGKLERLMDECALMTEYTNFEKGFRLGVMLAFEIFTKKEGEDQAVRGDG